MATPIKFTKEELKQVTELRDASQAKVVEFGQLKLERILTENRLTQLDQLDEEAKNSYVELQKQEADLVEQLKEKYGAGTVDVESGEFVPAK
tara:strand:+ start:173 stop:448 length:276 start_codon:yes stop_codon:yes gene_type:complete